jgi:hypothetical protein
MKNKAENVASRRVDAESRGHSLLTSKLYTPATHLRYLFRVSEYQPSANVPIVPMSDISQVFEVDDIFT